MKKKLIITLALLLGLHSLKAQITLEHTFQGKRITTYSPASAVINLLFTYNLFEMSLYNDTNYSLYKTFSFPQVENYEVSSINYVSRNIFSNDNKVEMLVYYIDTVNYSAPKTLIVDENGNVIKTFVGTVYYVYKAGDNKYRLIVYWKDGSGYTNSSIYKLPGSAETSVMENNSQQKLNPPYPNPSSKKIIIPYNLKPNETEVLNIFDNNGKVIDKKVVSGYNKSITIDVENYPSGIYYYRIKNIRYKFIVN